MAKPQDATAQISRRMRDGKRGPAESSRFLDTFDISEIDYDPVSGNITRMIYTRILPDTTVQTKTVNFTYDGSGRLTGMTQSVS